MDAPARWEIAVCAGYVLVAKPLGYGGDVVPFYASEVRGMGGTEHVRMYPRLPHIGHIRTFLYEFINRHTGQSVASPFYLITFAIGNEKGVTGLCIL